MGEKLLAGLSRCALGHGWLVLLAGALLNDGTTKRHNGQWASIGSLVVHVVSPVLLEVVWVARRTRAPTEEFAIHCCFCRIGRAVPRGGHG